MAENRNDYLPGIERMASALSLQNYAKRLLHTYDSVLHPQSAPCPNVHSFAAHSLS
jgi:hypothetical protein